MLYTQLKWDSDFFGFGVARINQISLKDDKLKKLLKQLKNINCKLVYWAVNPDDQISNQSAVNQGGKLIDKKTTFSFNFQNYNVIEIDKSIKEYIDEKSSDEMIELAIQSGEYSRFRMDINFSYDQFQKLYILWIENSVKKQLADIVYVFEEEGIIKGLITVFIKNNIGNIGLIGVNNMYRGQSIGSKLIEVAKQYVINYGKFIMNVVTQGENATACNFYLRNGFKVTEIRNFYHFWI